MFQPPPPPLFIIYFIALKMGVPTHLHLLRHQNFKIHNQRCLFALKNEALVLCGRLNSSHSLLNRSDWKLNIKVTEYGSCVPHISFFEVLISHCKSDIWHNMELVQQEGASWSRCCCMFEGREAPLMLKLSTFFSVCLGTWTDNLLFISVFL